jgi:hypothetical protein
MRKRQEYNVLRGKRGTVDGLRRSSMSVIVVTLLSTVGCRRTVVESPQTSGQTNSLVRVNATATTYAHVIFTGVGSFKHRNAAVDFEIPALPDERVAEFKDNTGKNLVIHAHESFLVVDTSYYRVTPWLGEKIVYAPPDTRRYAILSLKDREITVWDDAGDPEWSDVATCQGAQGITDAVVIPHLSHHGCNCQPPTDVELDSRVRVSAPGSTVTPYLPFTDVFGFALYNENVGQAAIKEQISQVVAWSFPYSGSLVLYRADLKDPSFRYPFVTIERVSGTGDIAIVIGSAPPSDLTDALKENAGVEPVRPDHHFEVYYDRCSNDMTGNKRVPIPVSETGCANTPPPWMPKWVWPVAFDANGAPTPRRKATTGGVTPKQAIVGSVNCGPDQIP